MSTKEVCEGTYVPGDLPANNTPTNPLDPNCTVQPVTSLPGPTSCPTPSTSTCSDFQLTKFDDTCFINGVIEEHLNIGAADMLVYKLLGVHEQGELIDLVGNGNPISSGAAINFPAKNAFTTFVTEWRTLQKGQGIIDSGYIGYDFGSIKLPNGRERYGVDTSVNNSISTIKIKQGNNSQNRVTRARIERSFDGFKWFGAAVIELPDDNCLNTIHFRASVANRYWRIRPIAFNGSSNDYWAVQALEMMDYSLTQLNNIEDHIWLENRNRDYSEEAVLLKGTYDLLDSTTDLSRFGIELPNQQMYIQMSFSAMVAGLGRPVVIGDIFEVPSETQYNSKLEPIKKYMEITDVGWSTEGFTPGWIPTILRLVAMPMLGTPETADIFGGLEETPDESGLVKYGLLDLDGIRGEQPQVQDLSETTHAIQSEAITNTPELGSDMADIQEFDQHQRDVVKEQTGANLGIISSNKNQLYVEDALPPNHLPYTEADEFPDLPKNGDYHRLTYNQVGTNIAPRLFRWSNAKDRWIWIETDLRKAHNEQKPILSEFLASSNRVSSEKVGKK